MVKNLRRDRKKKIHKPNYYFQTKEETRRKHLQVVYRLLTITGSSEIVFVHFLLGIINIFPLVHLCSFTTSCLFLIFKFKARPTTRVFGAFSNLFYYCSLTVPFVSGTFDVMLFCYAILTVMLWASLSKHSAFSYHVISDKYFLNFERHRAIQSCI